LNNFLGVKGFGKNETKESLSAAQRVVKEHRDFQLKLHEDFNLLAQDHVESSTQSVKKKHTLKSKPHISVRFSDGKKAPISLLHPSNIWAAISEHASEKFGFKFDLNSSALFTEFHRTAILREFSQKVGIQVLRKDYNFSVEDTFAESDTLNVYPVVKVNLPIGNEAKQILHSGQVYMSRGNLQMAFSLLSDGLHLLHQIVGPMHEETAQCYASLALICYYAGDFKQGLEYQHRALLISGAVYGIDHSETLHNHVNFALLLHLNQYSASAVSHMKKAYHISELLCGKDHPETVAVLFNLGIILQEMGNVSAAIEAFNSALLGFEACLGLEHLQTAACHHAVAIVNAVASNYRMAIQHEKKAKEIFSKLLGANHRKIEECQTWLKHFTSNAVFFESKTPEKITRPELQENNSKYNWIHTGLLPRVPISSSISIEDLLHHIQNYGGEEGSKLLKNLKSMAKKSEKKSEENDDASAAPALSRSQKKKLRQQKKKAVSSSST
jgi:protein TIF31